jgi:hypothetical protein
MNPDLLGALEKEVLGWPGVSKEPNRVEVSVYRLGRRHIGHVHHDGVADVQLPRTLHDELISTGRAQPHRGGFATVVSYRIGSAEDVPGAVELFRMSYEQAKAREERHAARASLAKTPTRTGEETT